MNTFRLLLLSAACVYCAGCASSPGSDVLQDGFADADVAATPDISTGDVTAVDTDLPDQTDSTEPLRREFSPDRPFFMFNVYMGTDAASADRLAALIPADFKPYFGVQLVGKYPYDNDEEHLEWVRQMVDAFTANDIPTLVQAEAFNTRSDIPMTFYESLFDRSPLFLGIVFAELSASGLSIEGMDADYEQRIVRAVETVAAHNGFFMWQDMGYEWSEMTLESGHPFVEAGASTLLFDLFSRLGRHVILIDKHNGDGKRFQGPAAAMGWWSSGLVNSWGVNSEDWIWWEGGWGTLFGPHCEFPKGCDGTLARWNFPLVMTGMDWLADLAGGASVFSIEVGFANGDFSKPTPAFTNVQLPFMRMVINNNLLISREEFRTYSRVAYQPSGPWGFDMHHDDIFKGLYGPEIDSLREWLPSTGRYNYLPILPTLAGPEVKALYHEVVGTDYWEANWKDNQQAKIDWFNERYRAVEGDSWVVNNGTGWFMMNPNENVDIATTFSFKLINRPHITLSGTFEPHTLAVAVEKPTGITIWLSNYRIDGQGMLDQFGADGIFDAYMADPWDDGLRRTELTMTGTAPDPSSVEFTCSDNFTRNVEAVDDRTIVTIDHNGPVVINIEY